MLSESPAMQALTEALQRLPGVGKRSAQRLALHLLGAPEEDARALSDAIRLARERVTTCSICCNLTEDNPCTICADPRRDHSLVCVIERPAGAIAIEKSGAYRGLYHVLHGALNPLDGVGPSQLRIDALMKRLETGEIKEVIIATNATTEGEATALYLSGKIAPLDITVTRIAQGVPMGSGLEFSDDITLTHALQGRMRLK